MFGIIFDALWYLTGGKVFAQGRRSFKDKYSHLLKVIDTNISNFFFSKKIPLIKTVTASHDIYYSLIYVMCHHL